jgi:hypothetical protein
MSHTLQELSAPDTTWVVLTIVNYTVGGESVALSELNNAYAVNGMIVGTVPTSQNSLGVPLFPLFDGGKVKLFRFVSGAPAEIPTTSALNAVVHALVQLSPF